MAQDQTTLMDPPIEGLLEKVDSKFTLVALAARRARQVNSYYNSLGEGLGVVVPPQVASPSGKPLSIAFEEVAEGKATYTRPDPEELARAEAEAEAPRWRCSRAARAGASRPICRSRRMAPTSRPSPGLRGRDDAPARMGSRTGEWPMTSPNPGRPPMVVLGVSAGIAAYKSVEVCRRLVDAGVHVVPVLTERATRFVGRATFDALGSDGPRRACSTGRTPSRTPASASKPTWWWWRRRRPTSWPATPGVRRRPADHHVGGDGAPVLVCPAMHTEMWEHPAVQHNLGILRARGVPMVPPEAGRLAGGDAGEGRMAEPEVIVTRVLDQGRRPERDGKPRRATGRPGPDLAGVRVVVSAGGTREPIDPVRFISNRSSGKQGHALAEAARRRGADVVLVRFRPTGGPGVASNGWRRPPTWSGPCSPDRSVPTWW